MFANHGDISIVYPIVRVSTFLYFITLDMYSLSHMLEGNARHFIFNIRPRLKARANIENKMTRQINLILPSSICDNEYLFHEGCDITRGASPRVILSSRVK